MDMFLSKRIAVESPMLALAAVIKVYHSSNQSDIEQFDISKIRRLGDYGPGFYFSTEKAGTFGHGETTYEVEINVNKPLVISATEPTTDQFKNIAKALNIPDDMTEGYSNPKEHRMVELFSLLEYAPGYTVKNVTAVMQKLGYDSIYVTNDVITQRIGKTLGDYWIVFSPNDIVSIEKQKDRGDADITQVDNAILQFVEQNTIPTRMDVFNHLIDQGLVNKSSFKDSFIVYERINQLIKSDKLFDRGGYLTVTSPMTNRSTSSAIMMYISKRAAMEQDLGVGISVAARKYWRAYYTQRNLPSMLGRNAEVNTRIAGDFLSAQPLHRFWLRSGEPAEIRRSHDFYYIAALRGGGSRYEVITIQARYKEAPTPEDSKRTLTPEWIQRGPRRKK